MIDIRCKYSNKIYSVRKAKSNNSKGVFVYCGDEMIPETGEFGFKSQSVLYELKTENLSPLPTINIEMTGFYTDYGITDKLTSFSRNETGRNVQTPLYFLKILESELMPRQNFLYVTINFYRNDKKIYYISCGYIPKYNTINFDGVDRTDINNYTDKTKIEYYLSDNFNYDENAKTINFWTLLSVQTSFDTGEYLYIFLVDKTDYSNPKLLNRIQIHKNRMPVFKLDNNIYQFQKTYNCVDILKNCCYSCNAEEIPFNTTLDYVTYSQRTGCFYGCYYNSNTQKSFLTISPDGENTKNYSLPNFSNLVKETDYFYYSKVIRGIIPKNDNEVYLAIDGYCIESNENKTVIRNEYYYSIALLNLNDNTLESIYYSNGTNSIYTILDRGFNISGSSFFDVITESFFSIRYNLNSSFYNPYDSNFYVKTTNPSSGKKEELILTLTESGFKEKSIGDTSRSLFSYLFVRPVGFSFFYVYEGNDYWSFLHTTEDRFSYGVEFYKYGISNGEMNLFDFKEVNMKIVLQTDEINYTIKKAISYYRKPSFVGEDAIITLTDTKCVAKSNGDCKNLFFAMEWVASEYAAYYYIGLNYIESDKYVRWYPIDKITMSSFGFLKKNYCATTGDIIEKRI